jgi:hypothetical protein
MLARRPDLLQAGPGRGQHLRHHALHPQPIAQRIEHGLPARFLLHRAVEMKQQEESESVMVRQVRAVA